MVCPIISEPPAGVVANGQRHAARALVAADLRRAAGPDDLVPAVAVALGDVLAHAEGLARLAVGAVEDLAHRRDRGAPRPAAGLVSRRAATLVAGADQPVRAAGV